VHPGITIGATVAPVALPVILELDGQRPLRDLVSTAVETTEFDPDEVRDQALAASIRLIELGLVEWR
jgi:hypothetical protein